MTTNKSTTNRPQRISPVLQNEIERMNKEKFDGRMSFSLASEFYAKKNREMEEELNRLRTQYGSNRRRLV